jgi:hypothetical protein
MNEAAPILGVELTPARQAGYDAVERTNGRIRRLQIKGRCLLDNCKPGQRLGSIRVEKEWDAVLMVLLDQNFDAVEIFEAERAAIVPVLAAPGSRARNERGAMAVSDECRSVCTCARLWMPLCLRARTNADCRLVREIGPAPGGTK